MTRQFTTEGATLADALCWIEHLQAQVNALQAEVALRRGALAILADSDPVAVSDAEPDAPR